MNRIPRIRHISLAESFRSGVDNRATRRVNASGEPFDPAFGQFIQDSPDFAYSNATIVKTANPGGWTGTRAQRGHARSLGSGKRYFEVLFSAGTGYSFVGVSGSAPVSYPGADASGHGWYSSSNPAYYSGTTTNAGYGPMYSVGQVGQVAVDFDKGNIWFGAGNVWGTSASASGGNPSIGQSPITQSAGMLQTNLLYIAVSLYLIGDTATILTGSLAAPFVYAPPAGFKPWGFTG